MIIKSQQLKHIQSILDQQLQINILKFLAKEYPEEIKEIEIDVLLDMIETGIKRSKLRNFTLENTITAFVSWMFIIAPNFDEYPIVKKIIETNNLEEEDKINEITESMEGEDWENAILAYDKEAWLKNYN